MNPANRKGTKHINAKYYFDDKNIHEGTGQINVQNIYMKEMNRDKKPNAFNKENVN